MSDKEHAKTIDMVQAGRSSRGLFPFTKFAKLTT